MKNRRHKLIREIVEQQQIETQNQLTEALHAYGLNVTQATISRDIKDLGLIKVSAGNNSFRYSLPVGANSINTFDRAKRMLRDDLLKVEVAHDIIVLKTLPGMAQGMGSCVDGLGWREVLGTIAGDDTVFVVTRDEDSPQSVAKRLRDLML